MTSPVRPPVGPVIRELLLFPVLSPIRFLKPWYYFIIYNLSITILTIVKYCVYVILELVLSLCDSKFLITHMNSDFV